MTPEGMAALHARAFAGQGRAWSAAEFTALSDSALVFALGDARAFALARAVADEAELLTIATDPAHRRKGLARQLLHGIEAAALARGALRLFLEVAADNAAAHALYRAKGYRQIACRAGYYPRENGRAADALVMEKALG